MPVSQQKVAKITAARAIDIVCEECEEHCVDEYGSTMITEDSKTVVCESCWTIYEVPANAFRTACTAKCRAKGKYPRY